jgi:hypothetical protein
MKITPLPRKPIPMATAWIARMGSAWKFSDWAAMSWTESCPIEV